MTLIRRGQSCGRDLCHRALPG